MHTTADSPVAAAAAAVSATTLTPPAIGQYWPGQGGIYVGVSAGIHGAPDAYLIRGVGQPADELNWKAAVDWAKAYTADGHTDFHLAERLEGALLYANDAAMRGTGWTWLGTEYGGSSAWFQDFSYGFQDGHHKSYEGRAVAVRRLLLQSFGPSAAVQQLEEAA